MLIAEHAPRQSFKKHQLNFWASAKRAVIQFLGGLRSITFMGIANRRSRGTGASLATCVCLDRFLFDGYDLSAIVYCI